MEEEMISSHPSLDVKHHHVLSQAMDKTQTGLRSEIQEQKDQTRQ